MKRLNADALPFDLHRDTFHQRSSATSPGLSTDDDDDDDVDEDLLLADSDDSPPSGSAAAAAATATSTTTQPDAIPDLIPSQRAAVDQVPPVDGLDGPENVPPSLHNGHSDDLGRSSPHDFQKSRWLN